MLMVPNLFAVNFSPKPEFRRIFKQVVFGPMALALLCAFTSVEANSIIKLRIKGDTGTEKFSISHWPDGDDLPALVYPLEGEDASVSTDFTTLTIQLSREILDKDIVQIGFTNDGPDETGRDRNLTLDWIEVDDRLYQTEDPSVYSQGNWNFDDCAPGFKQQQTLHCFDGYFEFRILDNRPPIISTIEDPVIRIGDTLRLRIVATDADGTVPGLNLDDSNPVSPSPELPDNGDGTRSLVWAPTNPGIQTFTVIASDAADQSIKVEKLITVNVLSADEAIPPGSPLRTLGDTLDLPIGFAAVLGFDKLHDSQLYADFARQQFSIVTPENAHKWEFIQPQQGRFEFTEADRLADFAACRSNGVRLPECEPMILHGHPLVWHQQLPGWVLSHPVDTVAERQAVEDVMKEHITTIARRYSDDVAVWDVVNEALEADGSYRPSIWYRAMNEEYLPLAFRTARDEAPFAKLLYNDYDIAWKNPKSDAVYDLVQSLVDQGVPIDGVGFQMHLNSEFGKFEGDDGVQANFTRFAALGLDIYITELDVTITEYSTAELEKQASVYSKVAAVCLQEPRCKGLQMWGYTDRYSWLDDRTPLPIDRDYQAKPAFTALQNVFQEFIDAENEDSDNNNEPPTDLTASFCSAGQINPLWFEYDGDGDTSHSLNGNRVSISDDIDYHIDSTVPIEAVIQVQDASNKNRPLDLEVFTSVSVGDLLQIIPTKRGALTLRFIVTVGDEQQTIDLNLNCGAAGKLEPSDEFGPITYIGSAIEQVLQ